MPHTMNHEPQWTTQDVAARCDVSYRTLRFYEQLHLVTPRDQGGVRLFSERDVLKVAIVRQGRKLGLSFAFIADLLQNRVAGTDRSGGNETALLARVANLEHRREETKAVLGRLEAVLRARRQGDSSAPAAGFAAPA